MDHWTNEIALNVSSNCIRFDIKCNEKVRPTGFGTDGVKDELDIDINMQLQFISDTNMFPLPSCFPSSFL